VNVVGNIFLCQFCEQTKSAEDGWNATFSGKISSKIRSSNFLRAMKLREWYQMKTFLFLRLEGFKFIPVVNTTE